MSLHWWPPPGGAPSAPPRGIRVLLEWRLAATCGLDDARRVAAFVAERFPAEPSYCCLSERRGVAVGVFRSNAELTDTAIALWELAGEPPAITFVVPGSDLVARGV
jgi:hypothetical protein